jgi:adenylate kinase
MNINEFKIIFVGGIHGVGKSQFSNRASQILRIPHFSASELITKQRKAPAAINKRVEDVGDNQDALITAIESHSIKDTKFILDGHFCVFDSADIVQTIPIKTFQKLSPAAVIVLLDEVGRIQHSRQGGDWRSFQLARPLAS